MPIFNVYLSFGFFWKIFLVLAFSTIAGCILSFAYRIGNRRSRQSSQPFGWLIIILPSLIAIIIFIVEDNFLRAMYLLGATTLIRFRNPVKNPLTTIFVLATVGAGACVGFRLYVESIALALVCLFVVFTSDYWGIARRGVRRILYLECQPSHHPDLILNDLKGGVRKWFPLSLETTPSEGYLCYSYVIEISSEGEGATLVNRLTSAGMKVHLIEPQGGEDF